MADVEANAEERARADVVLQKAHKTALQKMRWCEKCACTMANAFCHRNRQGEAHKLRKATAEETEDFSRNFARFPLDCSWIFARFPRDYVQDFCQIYCTLFRKCFGFGAE